MFNTDREQRMSMDIVMAFWAISLLFIIIPGADWAYVIAAGINGKTIVPAIMGLLLGHFIITLLVVIGIGVLITDTPLALTALTLFGSCYLFWLGLNLLKTTNITITIADNTPNKAMGWMVKGFGISGLNPKVFLLLLTLLPQFVDTHSSWLISNQMLALGMLHIASCAVIYLLLGYGAKVILQTRPKAAQVVSKISGIMMMLIAVILLINQIKF